MSHDFLLFAHVIGATVLLGTGAGIAFFMVMSNRSRDPALIAHVAGIVVLADTVFTATAALLQPVTGFLLARQAGWPLTEGWVALFTGIALWGLHMGLTQGILATMIADVAPPEYRGTAFGVFYLVSGLGLLVASGVAGALWDRFGPGHSFAVGAGLALVALLVTLLQRSDAPGATLRP